jgi:hypothetical protein
MTCFKIDCKNNIFFATNKVKYKDNKESVFKVEKPKIRKLKKANIQKYAILTL